MRESRTSDARLVPRSSTGTEIQAGGVIAWLVDHHQGEGGHQEERGIRVEGGLL